MLATFARYSGVIAGLIFFFSWLISTALVSSLNAAAEAMDEVQNERAQARQFADLSSDNWNLLESVERLETEVSKLTAKEEETASEVMNLKGEAEEDLEQIDDAQSNFTAFAASADQLKELSDRVPLEDATKQDVADRIQRAKALAEQLQKESESDKEATSRLLTSLNSEQDKMSDEEAKNQTTLIADHSQKLDKAQERIDAANEELLSGYDAVYAEAEQARDDSAATAAAASFIAYILYGLATIILASGRWLEDRNQSRSTAAI